MENKWDKSLVILLLVGTLIIAFLLGLVYFQSKTLDAYKDIINKSDTTIITKHDTLWKDTTITEKELVPKYIVKTKTDTVYTSNGDTLQLITESKMYDKRLTTDKDTADIQIYTSGINTSLDSLKWRLKTHTEIVTNNIEIVRYKKKRNKFNVSVGIGSGYGIINKQVDIYAGLTFGYRLWD